MIQYLLVERYSIECQRFYGWKSTWSSTESLEGENDIVFLYVVQFHKEINQVGYHLPSNRVYHLYLDDHHPWPGSFPNQWSWPVLCWCILLLQRSPAATVVISFSVAFLGALQIFSWKRNEWELKKSSYTDLLSATILSHGPQLFMWMRSRVQLEVLEVRVYCNYISMVGLGVLYMESSNKLLGLGLYSRMVSIPKRVKGIHWYIKNVRKIRLLKSCCLFVFLSKTPNSLISNHHECSSKKCMFY